MSQNTVNAGEFAACKDDTVEELNDEIHQHTLHYERLTNDAEKMNICAEQGFWNTLAAEILKPFVETMDGMLRARLELGGSLADPDIKYYATLRACYVQLTIAGGTKESFDRLVALEKAAGQDWIDSIFSRDGDAPYTLVRLFEDNDGQTSRADVTGDSGVLLQLGRNVRSENAKLAFYRQMRPWPGDVKHPQPVVIGLEINREHGYMRVK